MCNIIFYHVLTFKIGCLRVSEIMDVKKKIFWIRLLVMGEQHRQFVAGLRLRQGANRRNESVKISKLWAATIAPQFCDDVGVPLSRFVSVSKNPKKI